MACPAKGLVRKFMVESMEGGPTDTSPCTMPPPFSSYARDSYLRRKGASINQVQIWEHNYRKNQNMKS
ncbi:hypothetical protein RJ639_004832 [Escallonia herrerae]|uniref:Glycosyl transferase CAP10 domain-containing protein n=1 Tax=Escallonia herrerae TaxID=1293975 RepID=A0AA88W0T0_9ASTE|nr:hypothetical protein RJ639_004832 [Escallonia herrerae]